MQPDNNVGNNVKPEMPQGVSGGVATGGNSVTQHGASEEVKAPRKNTAMILGMVLLAVLAAGGIGFGVWAMLDGNQKTTNLNNEVVTLKKQNSDLLEQIDKTSVVDNCEDVIIDVDNSTDDNVNTADYIYIGEWGMKIKIPDSLTNLSYEYLSNGYQRTCRTLGVSASTVGDGTIPAFVKTGGGEDGDYLGYLMRCPKADLYPYGAPISIDDLQYDYYYSNIQYSITQTDWESESVKAVETMLITPGNYSRF